MTILPRRRRRIASPVVCPPTGGSAGLCPRLPSQSVHGGPRQAVDLLAALVDGAPEGGDRLRIWCRAAADVRQGVPLGVQVLGKSTDRSDRFSKNADPHGELVVRPLQSVAHVTRGVGPPKAKAEGREEEAPVALLANREFSPRQRSASAHRLAVPFPACVSVARPAAAPALPAARP